MARIDDNRLLVAATSEELGIGIAEALRVHAFDVHITDASVREFVYQLAATLYPTLIQQVRLFACRYRFDFLLKALSVPRIIHRKHHLLARFPGQHRVIIGICINNLSIHLLDNAARGYLTIRFRQRALRENLDNLQAFARILVVEEGAQRSCRRNRKGRTETRSGMRAVQFAQQFGKHLLEIVIVVDMRQETGIRLFVAFPIDAADGRVVELILYLTPCMVEDVFALFGRTIVEIGRKLDRFGLAILDIHLLQFSARDEEEVLALLVGIKRISAHAFNQQLGRTFAEIMFPQVISALEGRTIIKLVAIQSQHRIAQTRGIDGQSLDTVFAVGEVELQRSYLFLFLFVGFFVLVLFLLFILFLFVLLF